MPLARRLVNCNLATADGDAFTPYIQIPNGATKITVQFIYTSLDSDITCTMQQSLDGYNFDTCTNDEDTQVAIVLDKDFPSMTLNVSDLLTTWIRFKVEVGNATTGTLEKLHLIFS
jgi:hypothetical protein